MYSEWAPLEQEIQCNKANQSVLQKFPAAAGKEIVCSVVKHLAKNCSTSIICVDLAEDKDVKWTIEVLCFGLSLPLTEHEAIRDCVNIYCDWLTSLTSPLETVPKPIIENPNLYSREIIHHLLNLFVPRVGSSVDHVKRQSAQCQRVLRSIETVALDSTVLTRSTWETMLKFLLAANDSLLAPPAEKDDIGLSSPDIAEHLCERVLSVLFEIWILACARCFPSPSLWKTFRNMCVDWRHHDALIQQWHRINHSLLSRLLKIMYGPAYPELQIPEEDSQLIPQEMTNDCIAQSWFRFLHILQNPVDLCHPEIISQTRKFIDMVLACTNVIDPSEHECLKSLPVIFFHSMHGISVMVNAFLGIPQCLKDLNSSTYSSNTRTSSTASTPPGQRKPPMRPFSAVTAPLTQKTSSKSSSTSSNLCKMASSLTPSIGTGQLLLDCSLTMAPNRPQCNSILNLFGAWLFEAALAGVMLHSCHSETAQKQDRRTNSVNESRHSSIALDYSLDKNRIADNTYECGRAEACGTLCRIFCAHRTGEDILPVYYSRFYITMYYGLQTDDSMSNEVLSSILFNSCDLLRVDLAGAQILVPYILNALELVLSDSSQKFKPRETIPVVDLRKACFHLLLSMLCLPLHFRDLEIKDILSSPESGTRKTSFISLKFKITELLLRALRQETDASNTQMLLGGLMLLVQDLALCEEAEYHSVQPQHDICLNDSDASSDYSKSSSISGETSVLEGSQKVPPLQMNGFEDCHGSRNLHGTRPSSSSGSFMFTNIRFYDTDTAHNLFGQATSLVCHQLMSSWKTDLNTALAAMELLSGLAKVRVKPPNQGMSKRTVKWICDFIMYQCSRPPTAHSRDLHSRIVAAFKCLKLWLVEHSSLLYDKECLHNVLEVVELGISGSKSQDKEDDLQTVKSKVEKESKSSSALKHRASDEPKYKGEKQLKPKSMRVKDAAEEVLTCIIDQVGAFPPPCGPESLFSLLDEQSLLKYAKNNFLLDQGSPFRYFVLENSIILALLEQPLGNMEDPLPTVTALIRGPFGRHAWTMQLRHQPRKVINNSKANVSPVQRPSPMENVGFKHNVKHRYFPEIVETIPATKLESSIPTMESIVTEKTSSELDVLRQIIDTQVAFENNIAEQLTEKRKRNYHQVNSDTECKPPKIRNEFQTARLFLSHYGFLSLEALRESSNSSLPPALVILDSTNSALFSDLEALDGIPSRDSDTVHVFYMKSGQKTPEEIVHNVNSIHSVQPQFLEFLRSLGWPVFVRKHAGWTGNLSTSWKVIHEEDVNEYEIPSNTGGSIYDGRQQILYWADVSSEVAFVVPSPDTVHNGSTTSGSEQDIDKNPGSAYKKSSTGIDLNLTKPKSLLLLTDKNGKEKESPGSPPEVPIMRGKKYGRHPLLAVGPDTRVFVVWLESFEDCDNFPSNDLLSYTNTGMEQYSSNSSASTTQRNQEIYIIFIHALQNGLFRVRMQGPTKRVAMAIPLVDGMVVSRRSLGTLVRQTAINICRRNRLESESYQPPHVRRKVKIQEIVNKHRSKMTVPEFYAALFQNVTK